MNEDNQQLMLLKAARDAAKHAYAPYSNFGVGAALLMTDGTIITGANFENASYGLSLCAETVALATASAQGRLAEVVAVGVIGGTKSSTGLSGTDTVMPCGRCRQILNESAQLSGVDLPIYCGAAEGNKVVRLLLSQLLPHAFGPHNLGISTTGVS